MKPKTISNEQLKLEFPIGTKIKVERTFGPIILIVRGAPEDDNPNRWVECEVVEDMAEYMPNDPGTVDSWSIRLLQGGKVIP